MSSYTGPRVPLHFQAGGLEKAIKKNESYESFRPNEVNKPQYSKMEDRSSIIEQSRVRRYPNGELDYQWIMGTITDAVEKAERGAFLTPVEESLLTVFFPIHFQKVEAAQAEINTQLSKTEKEYLKEMIEAHFKEQLNYGSGQGGDSVPGRSRTIL